MKTVKSHQVDSVFVCVDVDCDEMYETLEHVERGDLLPCGHEVLGGVFNGCAIRKILNGEDDY